MAKYDSTTNGRAMAMGTLGLLAASSVGAALGLLFAPKSGAELRQDISDKADSVAKRWHKMKDKVRG